MCVEREISACNINSSAKIREEYASRYKTRKKTRKKERKKSSEAENREEKSMKNKVDVMKHTSNTEK